MPQWIKALGSKQEDQLQVSHIQCGTQVAHSCTNKKVHCKLTNQSKKVVSP